MEGRAASEPIQGWWRRAYLDGTGPLLPRRFVDEAAASLPGLAEPGCIQGSETFVVMRSHNRWLSVPKGVWEDDAADPRARGQRAGA